MDKMKCCVLLLLIGLTTVAGDQHGQDQGQSLNQTTTAGPNDDNHQNGGSGQDDDFNDSGSGSGEDDGEKLEPMECMETSCLDPYSVRVKNWMCEYTNYKIEAVDWKSTFDEWWNGCDESHSDMYVWQNSFECPDNSMVACSNGNELKCVSDKMGCTMCICKDGRYKDSATLFRVWRKEMSMFKARLAIYKSKIGSCTRSGESEGSNCPDPVTPTNEPGSGDSPGGGSGDDGIDVNMGEQ